MADIVDLSKRRPKGAPRLAQIEDFRCRLHTNGKPDGDEFVYLDLEFRKNPVGVLSKHPDTAEGRSDALQVETIALRTIQLIGEIPPGSEPPEESKDQSDEIA